MSDTILIGSFFLVAILAFSAVMVIVLMYIYLEQKKKQRQDEQPQEEQRDAVPPHIRQKNFDNFVKKLINEGRLLDVDRGYRHLRKKLMDEVQLELREYNERRTAESQPSIEKELERTKNGRRN